MMNQEPPVARASSPPSVPVPQEAPPAPPLIGLPAARDMVQAMNRQTAAIEAGTKEMSATRQSFATLAVDAKKASVDVIDHAGLVTLGVLVVAIAIWHLCAWLRTLCCKKVAPQ